MSDIKEWDKDAIIKAGLCTQWVDHERQYVRCLQSARWKYRLKDKEGLFRDEYAACNTHRENYRFLLDDVYQNAEFGRETIEEAI